MEGGEIIKLMDEKLANAIKRGKDWGLDMTRIESASAESIVAGLLTLKSYWEVLESDDWSFFECMAELHASPEELAQYRAMTPEQLDLLHRYVRFFVHCVRDMTTTEQNSEIE